MKISPLAPKSAPLLPIMNGVRMETCQAGIKYPNRTDLLLMVFDKPAAVAGVFTQSKCSSSPVDWCRKGLSASPAPTAKAVVVNAGNANAFTGIKGEAATAITAKAAALACGCEPHDIYLASTGVIGEPLEADKFAHYLQAMAKEAKPDNWAAAAGAIMTTDTYPKLSTQSVELNGITATINGIAKGSGMIAPDMATMLSFMVTDMPISQPLLQSMLSKLVGPTFNAVTVDSDTSTSDTLMLFATGSVKTAPLENENDSRFPLFNEALRLVMHDLAMQVIRDGEGASKQVEIFVSGAETDSAAKKIALSVANSPLVKTAVAGEDANWGRVVMAVGKAGEAADRDALEISFGDIRVAVAGERDPNYDETATSAIMARDEILISIDVGIANGSARVWTCDLTKEYVAINGDYRS
ncbi:MAG: bifunctional glutamate N-acetyltransferase/amino-acid acetyltransferase ArgJ [Rhizobiaceae bacterium]